MTTNQDIAVRDIYELDMPSEAVVKQRLGQIQIFQRLVRETLVQGHDYGKIPGTSKDTLLKPGAEKIAKLMRLADTYEIVAKIEDWDKGLFSYEVKCRLVHMTEGFVVSEGVGECNSYESKYRYRNANRVCPQCGAEAIIKGKAQYGGGWLCWKNKGGCGAKWEDGAAAIEAQETGRVLNEDPADQKNTILKMAKKRALVDASLSAGSLSDLFTQDMEDMPRSTTTTTPPATEPESPGDEQNQGSQQRSASEEPPGFDSPQAVAKWAKDTYSLTLQETMEAVKVKMKEKIPTHGTVRSVIRKYAIERNQQLPMSGDE